LPALAQGWKLPASLRCPGDKTRRVPKPRWGENLGKTEFFDSLSVHSRSPWWQVTILGTLLLSMSFPQELEGVALNWRIA